MKPYNACIKKKNPKSDKDAPQWSQLPTQETGLGNSRGPYALGNWRPPSVTSGKVFVGEGGSKEERRAPHSRAKPVPSHRDAPTSAVPPSPGGGLWASSGDSGLAAPRLPEESGARGAHPRAVPQLPPPPPRRVPPSAAPQPARAGAWPGTRPRPERGARTSSRQRNYLASRWVGIELISGDYLATPPVQTTGGFLSQERRRRRTRSAEPRRG